VPALDRAFALAEVNRVAVRVADDLDLDVSRPADVALDVDRGVAEGRARRLRAALDGGRQLALGLHHLHPDPASPARWLDHHWK